MDDSLLVGVLDRVADLDEQPQALFRRETAFVAVPRVRLPPHELHREVGPALFRRPRLVDLRDARVLHHRERLPLGVEARDHFLRIHSGLNHLERHLAPHRLGLLCQPDHAAAALAESLQ